MYEDHLCQQIEVVMDQNRKQIECIKSLMVKRIKDFFQTLDTNNTPPSVPPIPLATTGTSKDPVKFLEPQKIAAPETMVKLPKITKVQDSSGSYSDMASKPAVPVFAPLKEMSKYKTRLPTEGKVAALQSFVIKGTNMNSSRLCKEDLQVRPAELHAYRFGHSKIGQKLARSHNHATTNNPNIPDCQTCGMKPHGEDQECPIDQKFIHCLYCESSTHNTSVCHLLHAICIRCGSHGHKWGKKTNTVVNIRRFRDRFEKYADLGALTSLRHELPFWDFLPYPFMAYKSKSVETKEEVDIQYSCLVTFYLYPIHSLGLKFSSQTISRYSRPLPRQKWFFFKIMASITETVSFLLYN